jgi:alkyl hydroperoxide reductase subunit AhpF
LIFLSKKIIYKIFTKDRWIKQIMTLQEEKIIKEWGQTLGAEISIELTVTPDERSQAFRDFCEHLSRLAPKVRIKTEKEEEEEPPVIRIANVRYQAIPEGKELEPFLSVLSDKDSHVHKLPSSVREQLGRIEIPALLKIYVTPHCPFCPATVRQLLLLTEANESIKLTVIDGALFPESAQSDNVQSAPTVILDDQYRWTAAVQIPEVVDMILNRDPSRLSAASLQDMINEGDAGRVAEMMLDSGKLIPAFLELLVHEKWPVRLGAMVVFETLAVENYKLVARAGGFLWESFSQAEDTVKGDILYLMGKSGDAGVIPKLEAVLYGPYSTDVREAASEALEELCGT